MEAYLFSMFFIIHSKKGNIMNKKQKFIAGAMALTLITSAAPMSVSAKAKANYSFEQI